MNNNITSKTSVQDLAPEVTVRAINVFVRAGIQTVEDLVRWSADEIITLPHFDPADIAAVKRVLSENGFALSEVSSGEKPVQPPVVIANDTPDFLDYSLENAREVDNWLCQRDNFEHLQELCSDLGVSLAYVLMHMPKIASERNDLSLADAVEKFIEETTDVFSD